MKCGTFWQATQKKPQMDYVLRTGPKLKEKHVSVRTNYNPGTFYYSLRQHDALCEMKHVVQSYITRFCCFMVYFFCLWYRKTQREVSEQNKRKNVIHWYNIQSLETCKNSQYALLFTQYSLTGSMIPPLVLLSTTPMELTEWWTITNHHFTVTCQKYIYPVFRADI